MIKFRYVNKENIKKVGSAIFLTTMLTTSFVTLTSCGNDKVDKNIVADDNRKNYGIVFENDIACIYEITRYSHMYGGRYYYLEEDIKELVLSSSMTHFLKNYTLEEAEDYAKNLLTENGSIRYYNVEGKDNPKTLKKVK